MKKMYVLGMMFVLSVLSGMMAFADMGERQNAIRESYVLEGKANYAGAIKSLAGQYNQEPTDYFINLRMGWLNYLLGNFKNALQHYNAAIDAKGHSKAAGLGKVNTLMKTQDWTGYEDALKTLTKVFRSDYDLNLRLANYYLNTKKYEEGAEVTGNLIPYYPDDVVLLNTHGYLNMLAGKKEHAEKTFHEVLSISPDNVIAKGHLTELAKNKSS